MFPKFPSDKIWRSLRHSLALNLSKYFTFFKFPKIKMALEQPVEYNHLFYSLLFVPCALIFVVLVIFVQGVVFFVRLNFKPKKTARKGVVLLHQMPPNGRVLSVSPPCLKLETYLRMCKIPYESEYGFRMSSKGKVPWIELNEKSVTDSNFIVRFLNDEFHVNPDVHLSAEEKAVAHTMLVTLEENTYWYTILRFACCTVFEGPFFMWMNFTSSKRVWSGVGRKFPSNSILSSGFQLTVESNNVIALILV